MVVQYREQKVLALRKDYKISRVDEAEMQEIEELLEGSIQVAQSKAHKPEISWNSGSDWKFL